MRLLDGEEDDEKRKLLMDELKDLKERRFRVLDCFYEK